MMRSLRGPLGGLRWRDLSIQGKLRLVFGAQLAIIAAMGLVAFFALRIVEQQRALVREAQDLEALTDELQFRFVDTRESQLSYLLGWKDQGYDEATLRALPTHAGQIQSIRLTAGKIEALLENSRLPIAPRALSNTRTLVAVADFYEVRFQETVDALGLLASQAGGAYFELDDRAVVLQQAASNLEVEGSAGEDPEVVNAVFRIRQQEEVLRLSGSEDSVLALKREADFLNQRLDALELLSPSGSVEATRVALDAYLAEVDEVARLTADYQDKAASLDALIEESEPIWVEVASLARQEASRASDVADRVGRTAALALGIAIGVSALLGGLVTNLLLQSLRAGLERLTGAALRLEEGDLSARAEVVGADEFGQLAGTFNEMADRLQGVVGGLEAQASARARDLETIAEIGRSITSLRRPEDLLREVVELVQERFGFYHAQVFLLDEQKEYAVLRESTGSVGKLLLERGHKLAVGSQSVIGQVTARGAPVVALDTDSDVVHRRNELLPDTRSEMALPLRIGGEVIGALDVQSVKPNAFDSEDVSVFQTMADQLAVALRNAELFSEAQEAIAEVEALNRQMVGQAWGRYVARRDPAAPRAFRIEGDAVLSGGEGLPPHLLEKVRNGALVRLDGEEDGELQLAVPIRVRGEVIGAFGFGGEQLKRLSEDDIALATAVAERVGIALENIRLFEQTQQQARREQMVNEITAKIVGSTDVNEILQTTARELGRILRSPKTSIQLRGAQDDE